MRSFFPVSAAVTLLLSVLVVLPGAVSAAVMADHVNGGMPGGAILVDDTGLLTQPQPMTDVRYAPQEPYQAVSDDAYHTGAAYSTGTSADALNVWSTPSFTVSSDDAFHTGAAYSTGTGDEAVAAWQPAAFIVVSTDPFHTGDAYSTGTSQQARDAWGE